jgi:dihydroxyacid dehydratase/phosphogluconate dehydratase
VSDEKRSYRSAAWFSKADKDGFGHRSWMRNQGLPGDVFDGRPVIGICNTWSCPATHIFDKLPNVSKRGIWEAGGLPLEFPVMSLGEAIIRPTADVSILAGEDDLAEEGN